MMEVNVGLFILYLVLALIGGGVAGFFIARYFLKKQIQKNPPINEKIQLWNAHTFRKMCGKIVHFPQYMSGKWSHSAFTLRPVSLAYGQNLPVNGNAFWWEWMKHPFLTSDT